MKTKIIDILNKIANGEKIPKKIMYEGCNYIWNEYEKDYERTDINDYLFDNSIATDILNEEVEILETTITYKPDKIEKIEYYDNSIMWCMNGREITDNEKDLIDKINEIIDKINKE